VSVPNRHVPTPPGARATPPGARAAGGSDRGGLSRRGLLLSAGAGVGIVGLATVGQTVTPLSGLAVLAPRDPGSGPQGVAINRTAEAAGVVKAAQDPGYRFTVDGPRALSMTADELIAADAVTASLPIACVEGWSRGANWRGMSLNALLARAGITDNRTVRVVSIEPAGAYRTSDIGRSQRAGAVLATHLNGQRLTVDHGYPLRLIAPDRPGVLQTKWLTRVEV